MPDAFLNLMASIATVTDGAVIDKTEQKFEEKKLQFFKLCPELTGEDIKFIKRSKSMDIFYNGKCLNVGYHSLFPRNTRKMFNLVPGSESSQNQGKQKAYQKMTKKQKREFELIKADCISKFANQFFKDHPLYIPFKTLFSFAYLVQDGGDEIRISCGAKFFDVPATYNATQLTFQGIDTCWENASTAEAAIRNFIIKKDSAYESVNFEVRISPLRIGLDGYWQEIDLRKVPSFSGYLAEHTKWKKENELQILLENGLPAFYSAYSAKFLSKGKIKISFTPVAEFPIAPFNAKITLKQDESAEFWYGQIMRSYEDFAAESFLSLSNNTLQSRLRDALSAVLEESISAGYRNLNQDLKAYHPLYPILENNHFTYLIKQKARKSDDVYILTVGGCEVEYNVSESKATCVKVGFDTEAVVKALATVNEKTKLLSKMIKELGFTSYKITHKTKKLMPVTLAVSVKASDFAWDDVVSVDATKKELKDLVKKLEKAWKEFQAEKAKKEKLELEAAAKNPCYGDLFAADIVKALLSIDWNPALTYLRTELKKGSGVASCYTQAAIEEEVQKLCERGVLRTRRQMSCYTSYFAYSLTSPAIACLADPVPTNYGKNKKYDQYTDVDWRAFLQDFDSSKEQSLLIWKRQLPMWEHTNVLFSCQADVKKYYDAAPEQIKAYVKALRDVADDKTYKRALKQCIA